SGVEERRLYVVPRTVRDDDRARAGRPNHGIALAHRESVPAGSCDDTDGDSEDVAGEHGRDRDTRRDDRSDGPTKDSARDELTLASRVGEKLATGRRDGNSHRSASVRRAIVAGRS